MINKLWFFLIGVGLVFGFINNKDMSNVIVNSAGNAYNLIISLGPLIVLWSGIMCIAEKSGLLYKFSLWIRPVLKKIFPNASTIRMDIDTVSKKNSHEEILNKFKNENIDILIGTQMVVKGHHFPNVTLVGVIAADSSLYLEDYRSNERTFQILTQVAGRAGRENEKGNVIIQTYNPDSLAIEQAPTEDFDNGGPMIRVSPEMQKRTLNKTTESKNVNWEALEDTSKGEQQTLIKRKLGSTLTDTSIKREQILANEQAEKFGMEAEEQNGAETITQILTEKPQRVKGKWDNVNRIKKLGTTKLLQKDYYINKLARESGNQSLSEDSNNLRHANRIASQIAFDGVKEWKIDRTKSRRKGRFTSTQKAQGIEQIYESLENKGLSQQFDDYAYNLHNIDRMSIESKARDKMTELKDTTLKGYTLKQIESIVINSKIVLTKAINLGGTTIRSFQSSHDITGRFQNHLLVHTKSNCPKCNKNISKIRVGGRGTYYCEQCQKLFIDK